MILGATLIWGGSFVFMKDATGVVEPSWLIGIRFLLTAVILTVVFWRKVREHFDRGTLLGGAAMGAATFIAYWFQTVGLVYTTPGKNAFLTAIYCVIVPFLFWFCTSKRPSIFNVIASFVCIAGVGFVSLDDGGFVLGFGDAMTVVCGFFFAVQIVVISIVSRTHDVMAMTVYMFWVAGVLGILVGAVTEVPPQISIMLEPDFLFNMFYLVVFSSCVAMGLQNVAIAHVPASQAAILLSTESVFGVIFSVWFYGETLDLQLVVGFALIFVAIILSEAFPLKKPSKAGESSVNIAEGKKDTPPVITDEVSSDCKC
jgi:drug/metabolite transporter (DMT)-like permease